MGIAKVKITGLKLVIARAGEDTQCMNKVSDQDVLFKSSSLLKISQKE